VRRVVPALLLVVYALAFALAAFGGGLPGNDDHPGQFFRLWHALERSFPDGYWTADWNPDWWGGYPELQFYPPGFALVGAAIRLAGLWVLSVETTYQLLLAFTFALPGLATFLLLRAVLGDAWLALPPAFLALTLSAGLRAGVEESLHWGMLTSRLSLGFLPLLALALRPWVEAARRPVWAPLAAALVVLAHPANAPAAAALLALATLLRLARRADRPALREAAAVGILTVALTAFWTLPLLVRRAWVVPLTWSPPGESGLLGSAPTQPLLWLVAAAALAAWVRVVRHRRPFDALLAALPLTLAGLAVVNAVLFARGWSAIEPTRLLDGVVAACLWAAGLGLGALTKPLAGKRAPPRSRAAPALSVVAVLALAALVRLPGASEPALTLWPRGQDWPRLSDLERTHGLDQLWRALRGNPDRVLFLTSTLKLSRETAWYAPHSHALSLTPRFAGREIVNGTFTHPAPLAARFYTGRPTPPTRIDTLVERLDGRSLLGEAWERLAPETFDAFARRLRIATVVVPRGDVARARFLAPSYAPKLEASGFTVFERRDRPWPRIERITHRRYRVLASPAGGVWVPTGIPAYPLWQAKSGHGDLPTRVDAWGLLELRVPLDVFEAELVYVEGPLEWVGLAVSLAAALAWIGWTWRRRAVSTGLPVSAGAQASSRSGSAPRRR
jgi:hypothetical protein